MENASKALLIAGSVLIVILLIAVGMMIYNGARGTVDESISQMSSQQIQAFNDQFTQLGTTRVSGTTITSLIQKAEANNLQNSGNSATTDLTGNTPKVIGIDQTGVTTGAIRASGLYNVEYVKDQDTGLIYRINISDLGGASGIVTR